MVSQAAERFECRVSLADAHHYRTLEARTGVRGVKGDRVYLCTWRPFEVPLASKGDFDKSDLGESKFDKLKKRV